MQYICLSNHIDFYLRNTYIYIFMFMPHKAKVRYIVYFHSFKYTFLLANTSPIIFMKDNLQTTDMYIAVLSLISVICYVSAITSKLDLYCLFTQYEWDFR